MGQSPFGCCAAPTCAATLAKIEQSYMRSPYQWTVSICGVYRDATLRLDDASLVAGSSPLRPLPCRDTAATLLRCRARGARPEALRSSHVNSRTSDWTRLCPGTFPCLSNAKFTCGTPGLRRNLAPRRAWMVVGNTLGAQIRIRQQRRRGAHFTGNLQGAFQSQKARSFHGFWQRSSTPWAWTGTFRPSRWTQSLISSWVGRTKLANSGTRYLCRWPSPSPFRSWSCQSNICVLPHEAVSLPDELARGVSSGQWEKANSHRRRSWTRSPALKGSSSRRRASLSWRSRRPVTTWTTTPQEW